MQKKRRKKSVEWGGEKIRVTSRLLLDPDSELMVDILRITYCERLNNSCDPGYLNVDFDDKTPTRYPRVGGSCAVKYRNWTREREKSRRVVKLMWNQLRSIILPLHFLFLSRISFFIGL